ncbi:MAG: serine/threonine-protein kinase [Polyangiaceae bacterium]
MTAAGGTAKPDSDAAAREGVRMPSLAKYEVIEELGHGGMATVYRAHDPRLARDVAVKVLHPHLRESREIAHRFSVEAKAVAKLKHPNIVEVFDVSSAEDREQYLVVELIRGATLRKLLATHGALPPEVAAAIGLELIGALGHAHDAGVVHRDVKPENVLMEHRVAKVKDGDASADPCVGEGLTPAPTSRPSGPPSGGRRSVKDAGARVRVKLTDFGIAKLLDAQGVTSTGQVLGSPAHMAPEQIEGGDVDARADVFGLGVLLYECMVGHLPFVGNNPAQVLRRVLDGIYAPAERERPTVGKVWSTILDRALARDAERRFPSAEALGEALSRELERLEITSPRAEIEAFFDDPEAYHADHEARLVAVLSRLGAEARRARKPLDAAADYNRALAYAPADPTILRVVSTMHRAEARARAVRRAAPMVLAVLALGAASYGVARAVRGRPPAALADTPPRPSASTEPVVRAEPSSSASVRVEAPPPSASTAVVAVVAPPSTTRPPERTPKETSRTVRLATVRPVAGVRVSVDGGPPIEALDGTSVVVDDKAHELSFTCANDMCEPQRRAVGAGEAAPPPLAIEMRIRDATLVVSGSSASFYGIEQMPQLTLRSGTPIRVPMTRGSYTVVLFDRMNPEQKQGVTLIAGRRTDVHFGAP